MKKEELADLIARSNNFITSLSASSISIGQMIEVSNLLTDLQKAHKEILEDVEKSDS